MHRSEQQPRKDYKPRKRKKLKASSRAQTQRLVAREQSKLKQEKKVQEFQAGQSYDKDATLEFSPVSHLQVLEAKTIEKNAEETKRTGMVLPFLRADLPFVLRARKDSAKNDTLHTKSQATNSLVSRDAETAKESEAVEQGIQENASNREAVDIASQETNSFDAVAKLSDTVDFPFVGSGASNAHNLEGSAGRAHKEQSLDEFLNNLGEDFFQDEQTAAPWLDIADKIKVVKCSKPLFGSKREEEAPKRAKLQISKQALFRTILSCLITALIVGMGFFSWNRWFRYSDQLDFQGTWELQDSQYSLTINGSTLELNKDTSLNYVLNTFEKSISFSFGKDSAQALYEFSQDRNTLTIAEGKSPDIESILGIRPLADQGVQTMLLVREGTNASLTSDSLDEKGKQTNTEDGAQGTGVIAGGKSSEKAGDAAQSDDDLPKPVFLEEFMKKSQ